MEGDDEELPNGSNYNDNGILDDESILVEGLTTCLIVANVPSSVFEHGANMDHKIFENAFKEYGNARFTYLKSFKRVLVNFESSFSAAMAKIALHFTVFKERELKVYFKKVFPIGNTKYDFKFTRSIKYNCFAIS